MLLHLGWSSFFEDAFTTYAAEGLEPARVGVEHRGGYILYTAGPERAAEASPQLLRGAATRAELPAVGDWVAADETSIHAVLPRRTTFSRRVASDQGRLFEEQVVAANVDVVFLVAGLDGDFSPRRLERYLALAWESGADPVVVLTKRDLQADVDASVAEAEAVAIGVPVHAVSSVSGEGLDALRGYFAEGRTVAALGSSGAGKSTLVNALCGTELMETGGLRRDGRGRHTTTRRQLLLLPGGGLYLDTPGMRELRLWEAGAGLETTFSEIAELAERCRFRDCAHESEPGCAVRGAVEPDRLESWRKLQDELGHLERARDPRLLSEARKERRRFARSLRKTSW